MKLRHTILSALVATAALVGPAAAQTVLRASHNANQDEPYHLGMVHMGELLKEKTDGAYDIQVFANAQLGDEMESIQGTQLGTVDFAVTSNEILVNFVPEMVVFSMPFLFQDGEQMDRALSSQDVQDTINGFLSEKGFRLVSFFAAGTRHIMTRNPVDTMDDLAGMRIRTMQNPVHLEAFRQFGANPTPLAYTELYGALETGVVDGAEAANTNYHSQKFYEVSPNWALLGWLEILAPVVMGEAQFQALPADVQTALLEAGTEAGIWQRAAYRQSDTDRFDLLVAEGVNVTEPDDTPFREAVADIFDAYITTDGQKALLEQLVTVE